MTLNDVLRLPPRTLRMATWAGIAIGVVYALSPLTVLFALVIVPIVRWAGDGRDPEERGWVTRILVVAFALRLVALVALFLMTNHSHVAFGSFFGDEDYFIKRSLWLRNLALNIPLYGEDLMSAFDEYSASSYLYLLALLQMLVGPAPYGVHFLGIAFYLIAAILLYRLVRSAFGRVPAQLGLMVLLFLPSLFAWSVSALKEPLFMLVSAANFALAVKLARGPSWWSRVLTLGAIGVLVAILESIRQGGAVLSGLSVLIGLTVGFVAARPRVMIATLVAAPILLGAILSRPHAQLSMYTAVQNAARQHWGHVATEGYSYQLLDPRFYDEKSEIVDLQFAEAMRFLVRAGVGYIVVPLPWKVQSRAALAYLPEHLVWYVLMALGPVGLLYAFRRDAVVTGLLVGHVLVAAVLVALTSGNVGTLVRHRGLVIPYLAWLSAVGGCGMFGMKTT